MGKATCEREQEERNWPEARTAGLDYLRAVLMSAGTDSRDSTNTKLSLRGSFSAKCLIAAYSTVLHKNHFKISGQAHVSCLLSISPKKKVDNEAWNRIKNFFFTLVRRRKSAKFRSVKTHSTSFAQFFLATVQESLKAGWRKAANEWEKEKREAEP